MSIISEALKKANEDRHRHSSQRVVSAPAKTPFSPWIASTAVLALLVLPFAMPRLLNRSESASGPATPIAAAAVAPAPSQPAAPLLLADAPQIKTTPGLAQTAVETFSLPVPPLRPAQTAPLRADSETFGKLQGIVWTEDKGYYAILGNEVIRVGSRVGSMRVTQITNAGIALSDGTRDLFIEKSF